MILATYQSKSGGGEHHVTMAQDGETIYCTCRGWKMYRKCWHLEDYLSKNTTVTPTVETEVYETVGVSRQDIIDQEVRRLTI